ncbi:MAG: ABC transporter substrate-binding protein [Candidatus Sericytochromatia bacterium]|nr:ABC transporter substrate-binding protein [Candidatus Sericytochromatia bacterium]
MTWPVAPRRVISLSPATTEMVYAVGAEGRLLADTADCNYPPAAKAKQHVGKFGVVNAEYLLTLHPDLILATSEMAPKLIALRHLPCPVLALQTPTMASIDTAVMTVGKLLQATPAATVWQRQWRRRLQTVQQHPPTRKTTVFFVLWPDPLMTVSDHSFIGDIVRLAGGINVAGAVPTPYPLFSWESLLAGAPDWLVYTASLGKAGLAHGRWPQLTAVRQGRTVELVRDQVERSGPRSVDALEALHRALSLSRRPQR